MWTSGVYLWLKNAVQRTQLHHILMCLLQLHQEKKAIRFDACINWNHLLFIFSHLLWLHNFHLFLLIVIAHSCTISSLTNLFISWS